MLCRNWRLILEYSKVGIAFVEFHDTPYFYSHVDKEKLHSRNIFSLLNYEQPKLPCYVGIGDSFLSTLCEG